MKTLIGIIDKEVQRIREAKTQGDPATFFALKDRCMMALDASERYQHILAGIEADQDPKQQVEGTLPHRRYIAPRRVEKPKGRGVLLPMKPLLFQ